VKPAPEPDRRQWRPSTTLTLKPRSTAQNPDDEQRKRL